MALEELESNFYGLTGKKVGGYVLGLNRDEVLKEYVA